VTAVPSTSSSRYTWLTLVHLAATWWMVGMIWVIQTIHYPLFAFVGDAAYPAYQQAHVDRIGNLVGLPWLVEGLCTLAVFALAPTWRLRVLTTVSGLAMAGILLATMTVSAPVNGDLLDGFDQDLLDRLLVGNGVRTALWTLRGFLAAWITVEAVRVLLRPVAQTGASTGSRGARAGG
jgi:hypothetical protein